MGQWLSAALHGHATPPQKLADALYRIAGPGTWDARAVCDPPIIYEAPLDVEWQGEAIVLYGDVGSGKHLRARDVARRIGRPLFEIEADEWVDIPVLERHRLVTRMRAVCPRGGCVAVHGALQVPPSQGGCLKALVREFRGTAWRVLVTASTSDAAMARTALELRGVRAPWVARWIPTYPPEHRSAMVQLALIDANGSTLGDGCKAQRVPPDVARCPFALELLWHAFRRFQDEGGEMRPAHAAQKMALARRLLSCAVRTVAWNPWTVVAKT